MSAKKYFYIEQRVLEFLLFVSQLFLGLKTNFTLKVICNFGSLWHKQKLDIGWTIAVTKSWIKINVS